MTLMVNEMRELSKKDVKEIHATLVEANPQFNFKEGDKGCEEWGRLSHEKLEAYKRSLPYMCIHCKRSFKEVPKKKANECQSGYYHDIIRKDSIIERE